MLESQIHFLIQLHFREREIFLKRGKLSRILGRREHLKHKKGPDTDETPGKTVPRPILFQGNKL